MKPLSSSTASIGILAILITLSFWSFACWTSVGFAQQGAAYVPSSRLQDRSATVSNPFRRPRIDQPAIESAPYIGHVVSKRSAVTVPVSEMSTYDQAKSPLRWQSRSAPAAIHRPNTGDALPKVSNKSQQKRNESSSAPRVKQEQSAAAASDEPRLFQPPDSAVSLASANANGRSKSAPLPKPLQITVSSRLMDRGMYGHRLNQQGGRVERQLASQFGDIRLPPTRHQPLALASRGRRSDTNVTRAVPDLLADASNVVFQSTSSSVVSEPAALHRPKRSTELARLVAESRAENAAEMAGFYDLDPDSDNPFTNDEFIVPDTNGAGEAGYLVTPDYNCECGDVYCEGCGAPCCDEGMCEILSVEVPRPRELTLFGGVHAFKGPLDMNRDRGNFGIHEGFNWGGRFPWFSWSVVGYQIGYQLTHSQLHGSEEFGTSDPHTQQFVTAGLFRRTRCGGWQYGVVWDMLRDERAGSADFHQMRGELGFIGQSGREFGCMFAAHTNDTSVGGTNFRAADQYLLYYRLHAPQGGEARFFGGFDDTSKGILGANVLLPVHDRWSVQSGFTYMIPEQNGPSGAEEEAWNLGINLVWHFDARARRSHCDYYRPLFGVADNGSLIVDSRP